MKEDAVKPHPSSHFIIMEAPPGELRTTACHSLAVLFISWRQLLQQQDATELEQHNRYKEHNQKAQCHVTHIGTLQQRRSR
jgi:hypothetical protein